MQCNRFSAFLFVSLLSASFLLACRKNDNETPPTSNSGGGNNEGGTTPAEADTIASIRCTINGVAFISDTVEVTQIGNVRYYTGKRGNRRIIIATSDSLPNTYMLGSDDPSITYQSGNTVFGPAFSNTGSLIISTKDSIGIDGTFTANVQDILVTGQTILLPDGAFFNLPLR